MRACCSTWACTRRATTPTGCWRATELTGVPDDLPAGKYRTRVVSCDWNMIVLEYAGPYDPDNPTLISFTKEEEEG
jgi:hypothetical protein